MSLNQELSSEKSNKKIKIVCRRPISVRPKTKVFEIQQPAWGSVPLKQRIGNRVQENDHHKTHCNYFFDGRGGGRKGER